MSRGDSDKQQQTRKCNQRLNTRNSETNMSLFSPSRRQCQTEWRAGELADWMEQWLTGWLAVWMDLAGTATARLAGWLVGRQAGRQTGCLAGRQKSIGQTLRHITVKTHENISQQRQANCRCRRGGARASGERGLKETRQRRAAHKTCSWSKKQKSH